MNIVEALREILACANASGDVANLGPGYRWYDAIAAAEEALAELDAPPPQERCAKICDDVAYSHPNTSMLGPELNAMKCAAAIRNMEPTTPTRQFSDRELIDKFDL